MPQKDIVVIFVLTILFIGGLVPITETLAAQRSDALVLVNSASTEYTDFMYYIQPYLDNFGIPYTVVDIVDSNIGTYIEDYAVIIIGQRQIDSDNAYLDITEQAIISAAVNAGTGLVNFDNDLSSDGSTGRYQVRTGYIRFRVCDTFHSFQRSI